MVDNDEWEDSMLLRYWEDIQDWLWFFMGGWIELLADRVRGREV